MSRRILHACAFILALGAVCASGARQAEPPPLEKPVQMGDGVWFQQFNDIGKYGSNVSWIEFADFVVVVDTAFPMGAEEAIRNIKQTTRNKPIRYAVITHYHADHSFGTGAFAAEGATIVAHENARRDYLALNVGSYNAQAAEDEAYARYKAYVPDLTFTDRLILDDGKRRRVELLHLGHAHTSGDVFAWLPADRILISGDACVNGPFNYMGDSDSASWIDVLSRAQALRPEVVIPGHGAAGRGDLLETQKRYFLELRTQVQALVEAGNPQDEVLASVDIPMWKKWTGQAQMNGSNIEHVYGELTRGPGAWPAEAVESPVIAVPSEEGKERPPLKFLSGPLSPDLLEGLKRAAPNVEVVEARGLEEAMALAPGVHGMSSEFCDPDLLRAAVSLRWVQAFSAGVEHLVAIPELAGNDSVVLTNMKAMFGPTIADHAFAMLLSLTRSLPFFDALKAEGKWGRGNGALPETGELRGRTMLVVGLGGIGTQVAERAHAFGMRVVALDPRAAPPPYFVARIEKPEGLHALLPEADVVAVCCPLTPKTTGLLGRKEFSLVKPGAILINIARGRIVDTEALLEALKSGRLSGAGLDVTDPEPLPTDHPLWKVPNVVLTPHVAGLSPGARARTRALFVENLRRFGAGLPMLNVVDKKAGY
jgi:phosphoglycerate dehydrogenase-like enzyme/glyoxylase-like metal-dependent hydrolase (beta-lactamase superfamily II)